MGTFMDACIGRQFGPLAKPPGTLGDDYFDFVASTHLSSSLMVKTHVSTSTSSSDAPVSIAPISTPDSPSTTSTPQTSDQAQPSSRMLTKTSAASSPSPSQGVAIAPNPSVSGAPNNPPQPTNVPAQTPDNNNNNALGTHTPPQAANPSTNPSSSSLADTDTSVKPAFSHTQVAGTAAGGTAFLALIIGSIFYFLRRRRHARSLASTPQSWDPNRKARLPEVGGFGGNGAGAAAYKEDLHDEGQVGGVRGYEGKALPRPMIERYQTRHHQANAVGYLQPHAERSPTLISPMSSPSPTSPVSELGTTTPLVRMNAVELGDGARNGNTAVEMNGDGGGSWSK
jgi:hypothetical protein